MKSQKIILLLLNTLICLLLSVSTVKSINLNLRKNQQYGLNEVDSYTQEGYDQIQSQINEQNKSNEVPSNILDLINNVNISEEESNC